MHRSTSSLPHAPGADEHRIHLLSNPDGTPHFESIDIRNLEASYDAATGRSTFWKNVETEKRDPRALFSTPLFKC